MKLISSITRATTADGLYLHGFFQPGDKGKAALLHLHGFEGNFYENHFLDLIAERLRQQQITWLPANTRGNGKITDFNTTEGKIRTVGARYELLEDAHLDIDAWIEFLISQGHEDIILMGHSLGTYKAVRYLIEGKYRSNVKKLILLSPFDKKASLDPYTKKPLAGLITKAQAVVSQGKGDEMITPEFDEIVVSYKTWLSWYAQDDFGRCFEFCAKDYDFPTLKQIAIPTKIIVGSKDEFFHVSNREHPEEAMNLMLKTIPHSEGVIIPDAVHSFAPHEDQLVDEVERFL